MPDVRRTELLGEFGGLGLFVPENMWLAENNSYVYTSTKTTLTDQYKLFAAHIDQWMKYKGLSVAIYTQMTEVEHEVNGLLTYNRAVEKMEFKGVKKAKEIIVRYSRQLNNQSK